MLENKILRKNLHEMMNDDSLENKFDLISKTKTSITLPIYSIKPNPFQPRKDFNQAAINELAESIKQYGILNPIIVRKVGDFYEIVAGERRYRASIIANLETIPAIVDYFNDQEMNEIALIENIERENLSSLEISNALFEYQQQFNLTQYQLSKKFNKSRSYIANILRLRQLPDFIQEELNKGSLSVGHVRTLIGLNEEDALELVKIMIDKKLNVREAENLLSRKKSSPAFKQKEENEKILKNSLKRNVKITNNEIKISYKSQEELSEIIMQIVGKK